MKIWLINPYGTIPSEKWRDYSFSIIGKYLADQGHEVVWWTSNFSHHFKSFRSSSFQEINVNSRFKINLIPTSGYKNNIGLRRVLRDWIFSIRMYLIGRKQISPDLILYYESMLCLGFSAPALSKYHNCKLVYHQMDLWPELIIENLPLVLRPVFKFFFQPVFFVRKKVFKNLDGVMALAKPYLDSAISVEPGLKNKPNTVIYNGINVYEFRSKMSERPSMDLSRFSSSKNIKIIFAGTLGPTYDIENILKVAKTLNDSDKHITFIIAGDGPLREKVMNEEKKLKNLQFLGKLTSKDLCSIYKICDIGLAAYGSKSNVEMPDKFYDYTSSGLGIICSLRGEVMHHIVENDCGIIYEAGNSDSLLNAIEEMSSSKEILNKYKYNSFQCAYEYSSERQNQMLGKFLKKVSRDG